jgi:3-phosphoshikimate 1-carboxyvinyltransferase
MSHRALMFGAVALGETRVHGLLEGEDIMATAQAMRDLGATITREDDGNGQSVWVVQGVGLGGLQEPANVLDLGNAGTGVRLIMGLVAGHPIAATFTGDASLRGRPMGRVIAPLAEMGATFMGRSKGRLPMTLQGGQPIRPMEYTLPMPSAQVKSAVLLAGLNAEGHTTVIEPIETRDHTEKMLQHFGADVRVTQTARGRETTLVGQPMLRGQQVIVPRDPSSAAFPVVAALLVPESQITVPGVCINPSRDGLFRTLQDMGANLAYTNQRTEAGEVVADLVVGYSQLKGIDVPAARAPSMIDEYPILAVAAALAEGTTRLNGLEELRVKESNRFDGIVTGLQACGVDVAVDGDTIVVHGGRTPAGGATIAVNLDHRMAMSFLVMGLVAQEPVVVDDGAAIATSFPNFLDLMAALGAVINAGA